MEDVTPIFPAVPILEGLLFVAGEPISLDRICGILKDVDRAQIVQQLTVLTEAYDLPDRGLQIVFVAGGYQMVTRPEVAPWVRELEKTKGAARLSKPGLETLAVVAYQQPVTRAEIEMVRGVDSAGVLKTLMDRKLVRMVGRKEVPGRPMMYGTTRSFLEYLGISDLTALPPLKAFEETAKKSLARHEAEPLPQGPEESPPPMEVDA
jgi:segregation and condensation protein B